MGGQCPECGRGFTPGDSFCPGCGQSLRASTERQAQEGPATGSEQSHASPTGGTDAYPEDSWEEAPWRPPSYGRPGSGPSPSPGNRGLLFGILIGGFLLALATVGAAAFFWLTPASQAEATAPSLVGLTEAEARAELLSLDLRADLVETGADENGEKVVVNQDPEAGSPVNPGDAITVTLGTPGERDWALGGWNEGRPLLALTRSGLLALLDRAEDENEETGGEEGYWATREVTCGVCGGDGDPWDGNLVPITYYCHTCGGSGIVSQWSNAGYVDRWCGTCGGTGEITEWGEPDRGVCDNCNGVGTVSERYWAED